MELLVNLDVDDVERAVAFYTSVVGLRVGRRFAPDFVELVGAPAPIYLLGKAAGTPATAGEHPATRTYARHWTPVHVDFVIDDVDAAVERAVAAGATVESPARAESWGRIATLADPFGHGLCLIEWRGRGYDELLPS